MKNRLREELEAMLGLRTGDSFTADNVHTLVNGIFAADEGGGFEYVEYDDNAFPDPKIGSTANSISGLGNADETMLKTIFIMPNKSTNPDATMMIVVDEVDPSTDPKTYQYVYVGNINDLPSDVLTESNIVNDLSTGGTDKPLSAEQGRTLNSHVNYVTCGSGAADQVKLISDDGFELSTHLRLLVLMTNTNTHATPKFNINNTGIRDVWYNGSVASDTNTWSAGEVLDVYYDGTSYIASTYGGAQFSTGQKVSDIGIDDEPVAGSNNLVKSGGVANPINKLNREFYLVTYPFDKTSGYYDKDTGKFVTTIYSTFASTSKMRVRKGDILTYRISCAGTAIICCFNEFGLYLPDKSIIQPDGEHSVYESSYTVPEGVSFIGMSNYLIDCPNPSASLSFAQQIGDRIFQMSDELSSIRINCPFTDNAYYTLDGIRHLNNNFHSTDLIPIKEEMIIKYNCGVMADNATSVLVYDSQKNVIDYIAGISGEFQSGTYIVPVNGAYMVLTYYDEVINLTDPYTVIELLPSVINMNINNRQEINTDEFSLSGYITSNGNFVGLSGCCCTDFIDVKNYNQIECKLSIYDSGYCAFYFKDKTLCSTFQVHSRVILAIPFDVKYVRICNFTNQTTNPSAILHKVSNYWENKRFAIFGTSIEAGYPKSSFANNRNRLDTYSFWNQAVKMLGGFPLNYAVPSGFICKIDNNAQSFLGSTAIDVDYGSVGIQNVNINNRLLNYIGTDNDADVYVFAYHVNDTLRDESLIDDSEVNYNSTDQTTFVGAYNYTLTQLFTEKPDAIVILASHYTNDGFSNQEPNRYKKVNEILKNLAKKWNIIFINISQSAEIINNGFINNYAKYMTDAGHPANYNPSIGIELIGRIANAIFNRLKNFE